MSRSEPKPQLAIVVITPVSFPGETGASATFAITKKLSCYGCGFCSSASKVAVFDMPPGGENCAVEKIKVMNGHGGTSQCVLCLDLGAGVAITTRKLS